jgi:hypothetical protein
VDAKLAIDPREVGFDGPRPDEQFGGANAAEQVGQRAVGGDRLCLSWLGRQHPHPAPSRLVGRVQAQRGLADARRALDQ